LADRNELNCRESMCRELKKFLTGGEKWAVAEDR
jgi:hypothetical protein